MNNAMLPKVAFDPGDWLRDFERTTAHRGAESPHSLFQQNVLDNLEPASVPPAPGI